MKNNQPVTAHEMLPQAGKPLVSKTDLKGIITYANENFVELSGFSRAELLGSNHNLIRHPDMPAEVFADLWRTIKAGHPWRGLVKNRCKNGDYYWVEANVTPIWEGGQVNGYMSVRRRAEPAVIAQVAEAYRLFREQRQGSRRILRGRVVSLYLWAFAGFAPLGGLLAGWLTEVGGTQLAFFVAGTTGLVMTLLAARELARRYPDRVRLGFTRP